MAYEDLQLALGKLVTDEHYRAGVSLDPTRLENDFNLHMGTVLTPAETWEADTTTLGPFLFCITLCCTLCCCKL